MFHLKPLTLSRKFIVEHFAAAAVAADACSRMNSLSDFHFPPTTSPRKNIETSQNTKC